VNNKQEGDGKSLLHLAASYSSPNLTKFLLENGADPNQEDLLEKRPAYYAEIKENAEVLVQLLIGEARSVNTLNVNNNSGKKVNSKINGK